MKLVWSGTDKEALPDFEYFNKLYERLPRAEYVKVEDYVDLKTLHDLAGNEIIEYEKKIQKQYAEKYENKGKSANNTNSTEQKKPFKPIAGKRKKMFTESDIENMRKLLADGNSKREIARTMGCSEKTIRNYLKSI